MERHIKQYGAVSLMNLVSERPQEWDTAGASHVRVSLPADMKNIPAMHKMGYQLADRMLDATINLQKSSPDLEKAIRIKPVLESGRRDEILQLAVKSFCRDRRFHVETEYNDEIAAPIIKGFMEEIPKFFICTHKEELIGFLGLKEHIEEKSAAVYLAAVDDRCRASGAAVSLYAAAVQAGKEKGLCRLTGYISTANTAVINLYAYFGGTFTNPQDIYLKKIR